MGKVENCSKLLAKNLSIYMRGTVFAKYKIFGKMKIILSQQIRLLYMLVDTKSLYQMQ